MLLRLPVLPAVGSVDERLLANPSVGVKCERVCLPVVIPLHTGLRLRGIASPIRHLWW